MNDAILSLIITTAGALLALIVRYSYISKCNNVKCFGCIEIHRDVSRENQNPETSVQVSTPNGIQEQKSFSKV